MIGERGVAETIAGDWRADPIYCLFSTIRLGQALYYAVALRVNSGSPTFSASKSFRVEWDSGRPNGQGSQRDCFEAVSVAYNEKGNVFGVKRQLPRPRYGGHDISTTPHSWHATTDPGPDGRPYMQPNGVARANKARAYWDLHADGGFR